MPTVESMVQIENTVRASRCISSGFSVDVEHNYGRQFWKKIAWIKAKVISNTHQASWRLISSASFSTQTLKGWKGQGKPSTVKRFRRVNRCVVLLMSFLSYISQKKPGTRWKISCSSAHSYYALIWLRHFWDSHRHNTH